LREHREDIAFLAKTFLQRHVTANKLAPRHFSRQALQCLERYHWPGNVRELSHVVERAVTLSTGEEISPDDLALEAIAPRSDTRTGDSPQTLAALPSLLADEALNLDVFTQHLVQIALQKTHGHKGQAAALLGVHPRTLTRMIRRYGLPDQKHVG
jgi:two-component system response regulator PilR (NtrC family)/two-component system response regulator HydG